MAVILHIETATTVCSVALAKDGVLLSLKEQNGDYSHAENLTIFIEDVLQQAKITISEIDAVAVSKGPGSYTGLRIGISTAKGLCYSLDKPLIAVDTLKYLSLAVASSNFNSSLSASEELPTLFCPMLDARRMEVYCAIYNAEGNTVHGISAEIIDEHSFSDILNANQLVFFGDGSAKCKEVFSTNKNAFFIDDIVPSAKDMIGLSEYAFNTNQFEDVAYFEPFYLKDFVAGKKKAEL